MCMQTISYGKKWVKNYENNEFNQFPTFQLINDCIWKLCFNVWILLFSGKTIVGTQVLSMRTAHYEMQKKELNVIVSSYQGIMLRYSKKNQELLSQMEAKYLSHLFSKDGTKSDVKVTIDTFQNILLQKWWVQFPLSVQCTAQCSRPPHPNKLPIKHTLRFQPT